MSEKELSAAEAELYDRQIRLWGIESQSRLRAANVLLIGIRGLGSEIAKNILLSGINSLTILDEGVVTENELLQNFLLNRDSIGQKIAEAVLSKAQALNPLVKITTDTSPLSEKTSAFYKDFTIIVATGLTTKQLIEIDSICRDFNVQFICGDVFGMFGYSLSDFQMHEYYVDQIRLPNRKRAHDGKASTSSEVITEKIQAKLNYPSINDALLNADSSAKGRRKRGLQLYYLMKLLIQFRDKNGRNPSVSSKDDDLAQMKAIRNEYLQDYQIKEENFKADVLNLVFGEITPICSIVGGVVAQEVIKAVSHKEAPIHNIFLLNPYTFSGKEEMVGA
ncbi:hypothetical protein PPYR_08307 [Photinus pyralis]|uniref:THIF-type NAD/FAD binding fold domain-containing protein n=1 Tax=Photinus pyralis TaxID=7054 RepID=A0A1Y1KYP4_PHOPY|nr:SUMO-activating enzyme subunit 1 [Photinus pyralis]KAB0797313.1 hypothetical protein PPYR_08307 [Photinus pyralis]